MRPTLSIYHFENLCQLSKAKMVSERGTCSALRICAERQTDANLCSLLVCPLISHSGVGRWQQVAGEGGDRCLGQDIRWVHREGLRQKRSSQEPVRSVASALRRWTCPWAVDEEAWFGTLWWLLVWTYEKVPMITGWISREKISIWNVMHCVKRYEILLCLLCNLCFPGQKQTEESKCCL